MANAQKFKTGVNMNAVMIGVAIGGQRSYAGSWKFGSRHGTNDRWQGRSRALAVEIGHGLVLFADSEVISAGDEYVSSSVAGGGGDRYLSASSTL